MAVNLSDTKRRIKAIESIGKTTGAMGLIATVKSRRLQGTFFSYRTHFHRFQDIYRHLLAQLPDGGKKIVRPENRGQHDLYIVVASDMGLCGSYNSQLLKYADLSMNDGDFVIPLGNRAIKHFSPKASFSLLNGHPPVSLNANEEELTAFAQWLIAHYMKGEFRHVVLIGTKYVNSLKSRPAAYQILPISLGNGVRKEDEYAPPIIEGNAEELARDLLGEYVKRAIGTRILESSLSEQSSRRNAMEQANDNVEELIEELTLKYNKARQEKITQEITEITAGN